MFNIMSITWLHRSAVKIGVSACFLAASLLALFVLSGCASPVETSAGPGQQFSLAVGQQASITGEPLEVRFVRVISDSRCPQGATCIWQGEVSCQVEITYQGTAETMVLVQPGLTTTPSSTDFNDYHLEFNVQPYPQLGKETDKRDYRLQLTVVKQAS